MLASGLSTVILGAVKHKDRLGGFERVVVEALDKLVVALAQTLIRLALLLWNGLVDLDPHGILAIRDGADDVAAAAPLRGQVQRKGFVLLDPHVHVRGPGVAGAYKNKVSQYYRKN